MGFFTGVLVCLGDFPGEPLQPLARSLCIGHLGGDTLPPPCWLPYRRPDSSYHTIPCHVSFRIPPHPHADTSSSVKSRGTVSGTSSYSSKAAHAGFSTGGNRVSGCFFHRTSATGRLVFVHWLSGRRHPPPSLLVARWLAYLSLP